MDENQVGRIHDDLRGFFRGELHFDALTRSVYSTDASLFQVRPAGVVVPRDEEDLQSLVRYAREHQVPLIARGAGTGLSGESLGKGLVVDLSKHFRQILHVGSDSVRVQPGVVLQTLQDRLRREGRRFAPDPASAWACTIGGMLATNASGSRALIHGYTRDHVRELRLLLSNGELANVGAVPLPLPATTSSPFLNAVLESLVPLLENQALIRSNQPRTAFNRFGYLLDGVCTETHLHLPRLLIGSEGTLALFTEATLRTVPLAGGEAAALVCFSNLDVALRAASEIAPLRPAVCDLLGRRLFSLARLKNGTLPATQIPAATEAVLLLEFEGESVIDAESMLAQALGRIHAIGAGPSAVVLPDSSGQDWNVGLLRESILTSLYAVKGGEQPVSFIEDVAVPLEHLSEAMLRIQDIFKEHETTGNFLIHAASGQIHARPLLDLNNPDHVSRLSLISDRVHSLVLSLGGSISSQHGTGLARTAWVARQYGPLYSFFRQIKSLFDPDGILNPGKIVDPPTDAATWPLRLLASEKPAPSWSLTWPTDAVAVEANHCNGCGHCRQEASNTRICPVFRALQSESASPRGKVNALRETLGENGESTTISGQEMREVADHCVHCKMCALECPARVNVDKLMLEVKAANVAHHGLERGDWFFARMEKVLRWGSFLSFMSNVFLRSGTVRWIMEKVFGLSSRRRLPKLARRSFWSVARRRGWTARNPARRPTVVYFPDLYATYIDPELGEATCLVLEHNGFDVFVPPGLRSSGIEALVAGDVSAAREMAQDNLRALADLAREGVPIVCSEPSSAIMFTQDYRDLIPELDSQLVAQQTIELTSFLNGLASTGKLQRDFQPLALSVAHHIPCHVKALPSASHGPDLMRRIPGMSVRIVDVGCSGMAGTFGLKAKNLKVSLDAGKPMLDDVERGEETVGSSECSSCRLQMENGTGKRALHPVQYLALSYGLMPRLKERLSKPVTGKLAR